MPFGLLVLTRRPPGGVLAAAAGADDEAANILLVSRRKVSCSFQGVDASARGALPEGEPQTSATKSGGVIAIARVMGRRKKEVCMSRQNFCRKRADNPRRTPG